MSRNRVTAFAFTLFLAAQPAWADVAPPLTLESTILFALNQNPSVKAEVEKIKQAQSSTREARANYYPQINVRMSGGHEYDNPGALPTGVTSAKKFVAQENSADMSLVVDQVLYNGFATDEEVYRRKALENSATYGSLIAIENVLQSSIQYYVGVWQYQRAVDESEKFVAQIEKIGKKISLMNEAGAESKAKKEYVDSRVAAAHTELNTSKASLTDALNNLESFTGSLPLFTAQRPTPLDPTLRPVSSYFTLAEQGNNHLLLNSSDHEAVEHQIEEQKAAYLPTVNLELTGRHSYDVGGPVGNNWNASAMVQLQYKIFDGFSRDAAYDRLASQKSENEFRQKQLTRDTVRDIHQSYNKILATKQDLTSNMKEILSSENLQDLYEKQFELGEGDIITMIEGAERLHTARLRSFRLEASMSLDSYTLLQKAGALKKDQFCASC